MPILTYKPKNKLKKFVTSLFILTFLKNNIYNFIFVFINIIIKIILYKLIKIAFNAFELTKVIISIIILYYNLSHLIKTNNSQFFSLKFCFLFSFFLKVSNNFFLSYIYKQIAKLNNKIK